MIRFNRFFANNCERTGVWAALSERSYEVGERSEVGALEVQQKMHIRK